MHNLPGACLYNLPLQSERRRPQFWHAFLPAESNRALNFTSAVGCTPHAHACERVSTDGIRAYLGMRMSCQTDLAQCGYQSTMTTVELQDESRRANKRYHTTHHTHTHANV